MSTLIMWKMCNSRMCQVKANTNIVRKWSKTKQNLDVVGGVNNQAFVIGLVEYWRHVHVAFEGTFTRSVKNFFLCRWFIKEACKWEYDYITRLSKGGIENWTTWGNKIQVSHNANWKGKMFVSTCAITSKRIKWSSY